MPLPIADKNEFGHIASSSRPSSGGTSGTDPPGVIIPYQDNLERANATIRQQALQLHQKEIEIDNLRSDIRSLIGALPQSRNARPSRPSRSSPSPSPSASAEPLSASHSANALAPIIYSPRTAPETPAPAHQAHPNAPAAVAHSAPLEPIEGGQTSHVTEGEQRTSWVRRIGSRISKLARRT